MSDLLGIGASAVGAYSAALGVIGENVANAQTEGYARRGIAIQSDGTTASGGLYTNRVTSGGSTAAGVTRGWDQFKAADALDATADDGRAAAAASWLDSAGAALPDGAAGNAANAISGAAGRLAAVSNGIGTATAPAAPTTARWR